MQGRKKKLLLLGGLMAVVVILFGGSYLLLHKSLPSTKKVTSSSKLKQSPEQVEAARKSNATLGTIIQKYEAKSYADVITLTRSLDADPAAHDTEKQQAYSLCLDAAVQSKDASAKEFCYKKAKVLAQANADERTRQELTKKLDDVYSGTTYTEGSINDGKSQ